jgi:hypothetical protein
VFNLFINSETSFAIMIHNNYGFTMKKNPNISYRERMIFQAFMLAEKVLGKRIFAVINPFKIAFLKRLDKKFFALTPPEVSFIESRS